MEKKKLSRNIPISIFPPIMYYNRKDVDTLLKPLNKKEEYANLYLHIPFCPKRCHFCYFTSFSNKAGIIQKYVDVLANEIEYYASQELIKNKKIHTIYIGGGTPTFLNIKKLNQLFKSVKRNFMITDDAEICIEVRPGKEAKMEKLKFLIDEGVNRISIGVQSFDNNVLKTNGRTCRVEEAFDLLDRLNKLNFKNINIDIMSGMLNETEKTWQNTIDQLVNISPQNITIYKMQLYENSKLTKYCKENDIEPMTESLELDYTKKFYYTLLNCGYKLMSSTYSFTKDACNIHKHRENRNRGEELIALGLSANGFINRHVYQKTYDIDKYLKKEFKPTSAYRLKDSEYILRGVILGLKSGRIKQKDFYEKYKVDIYEFFKKEINNLEKMNYLIVKKDEILVAKDIIYYIDDLLRTFFMPKKVNEIERIMLKYKNFNIRKN